MRYLRYAEQPGGPASWGRLDGDRILPASPAWADDISAAPRELLLRDATLLAPLQPGARVFCVGLNYALHLEESGRALPPHPSLFLRTHQSLSAPGAPIVRPRVSAQFDYEAELAVVIGKHGRYIRQEHALEHIVGYTCLAENSVRDYQKHSTQATAGKNFDSSGAIGPWIVTSDEIPDPGALRVIGRLNGETMQDGSVADLIFPISHLVAYISQFTALLPGDVIATGTPAGVGAARMPQRFMRAADQFEVEIAGIGTLHNHVVDES